MEKSWIAKNTEQACSNYTRRHKWKSIGWRKDKQVISTQKGVR